MHRRQYLALIREPGQETFYVGFSKKASGLKAGPVKLTFFSLPALVKGIELDPESAPESAPDGERIAKPEQRARQTQKAK